MAKKIPATQQHEPLTRGETALGERPQSTGGSSPKARRARSAKPAKRLNHRDKLLLVADALGEPVMLARLAVAAWSAYPASFGILGYEHEHPDMQKVIVRLSGAGGLVGRKLLRRVVTSGASLYEVSQRGHREALRLRDRLAAGAPA